MKKMWFMIIHIGREQMGIQMNVFLINISVASFVIITFYWIFEFWSRNLEIVGYHIILSYSMVGWN